MSRKKKFDVAFAEEPKPWCRECRRRDDNARYAEHATHETLKFIIGVLCDTADERNLLRRRVRVQELPEEDAHVW